VRREKGTLIQWEEDNPPDSSCSSRKQSGHEPLVTAEHEASDAKGPARRDQRPIPRHAGLGPSFYLLHRPVALRMRSFNRTQTGRKPEAVTHACFEFKKQQKKRYSIWATMDSNFKFTFHPDPVR
jgi:hypothetical protein